METGMLHTHHLFVVLYLLLFAGKAGLVFARKPETLRRFNRKTRILHIVLAAGFTLTGIYLVARAPDGLRTVYLAKYGLLVLTIGVGVVAIKRANPVLTGLVVLLLAYTYGISKAHNFMLLSEKTRLAQVSARLPVKQAEDPVALGKALYQVSCLRCHGPKGDAAYRKSKNLTVLEGDANWVKSFLEAGPGTMPTYDYLAPHEADAIAAYVLTLREGSSAAPEEQ